MMSVQLSTLGEYRGYCQKCRFLSGKSPTRAHSALRNPREAARSKYGINIVDKISRLVQPLDQRGGRSVRGVMSCREVSTVRVVRFWGRPWFSQGFEVWRILLGYHFQCVRDSGEQRQEFVHTNFRHGPRFYRITYRAGRPSSASSISAVSRPICTANRTTSLRVRSPSF
jgi:hypothetical protein